MLKKILLTFTALVCVFLASCGGQADTTAGTTAETTAETAMLSETDVTFIAFSPDDLENINRDTEFSVSVGELRDTMERIETSPSYPAEVYTINVTDLSVPVKLTMNREFITVIEAHGQTMELSEPCDVYGNFKFDLFEADGAVILQWSYYYISDIYVLTEGHTSEVHPGENASYYLYLDESGDLKYRLSHNKTALITQTCGLSAATGYNDFLYAVGNASIDGGEVVFAEPSESYTFSDVYDLDEEFKTVFGGSFKGCDNIEAIFENNKNK